MNNENVTVLKPSEVRLELTNLQRNIERLDKIKVELEGRYASVMSAPICKGEKESLPEKSIVPLAGEIRDINKQLIKNLQYIDEIIQRCEL